MQRAGRSGMRRAGPRACIGLGAALVAAAAPAQEVRVGAMADLTGAYSTVGRQIQSAQELAARHVNEQGGLFATGTQLTLVPGDGGCAAETAVPSGRALLADPAIVSVIGPTCSGATIGLAREVAIPAGRVVLSHSATAPAITRLEDDDLVFRMAPSDAYLAVALSAMVLDRYLTRVAVTHAPDDYNAGVAEAFLEIYRRNGGRVTAVREHVPGETDYDALVAELSEGQPEALVLFAYYDGSGSDVMAAALRNGGFDAFIGADGMINDGLIAQVGARNLGTALFMIAAADTASGPYLTYAEGARAAGLDPEVAFTAHGYDAAFVTALAIEQLGAADPAGMPEALRRVGNAPGIPILPGEWAKAKALIAEGSEIDYVGASGAVEFDPAGDTSGLFAVHTVNPDGSWTVQVLR